MNLQPCDETGVPIDSYCPTGYTWDQANCRCESTTWADDCYTGANEYLATRNCPTCLRAGMEIVDKVSGVCPDGYVTWHSADPYPSGQLCAFGLKCVRVVNPNTGVPDDDYNASTHPYGPWGVCGGGVYWYCPPPATSGGGTSCTPHTNAVCTTPTCPEGYEWNQWTEMCEFAGCEGHPDGECWCNLTESCMGCPAACVEELNCVWDEDACEWACDEPSCPEGQVWNDSTCACEFNCQPCLVRDHTGQFALFFIDTTGALTARLYNPDDALDEDVVLDSDPTCCDPSFYLHDGVLLGTYRCGADGYAAVSYDHGRSLNVFAIPGTWDFLTSQEHKGRIVAVGWRASESAWKVVVGKLDRDGTGALTVTWGAEATLTTTSPTGRGHLRRASDEELNFVYEGPANTWQILTSRKVALDGTHTFF